MRLYKFIGVFYSQPLYNVKKAIAKEVVLTYPDFTKLFELYTDASTKQLRVVITQDNRPIKTVQVKNIYTGFWWNQNRTKNHCNN